MRPIKVKQGVTRKPQRLTPGDLLGIAAPAAALQGALAPGLEGTFRHGVQALERLGFRVRVAKGVLQSRRHPDVPAHERAEDLNALFADHAVKGIICVAGGSGANAVLPLLDWSIIERQPKVVMGYSAITALLNGLYARTGLVTFHGPMVLNGFSEFPDVFPYTRQHVLSVLSIPTPAGKLEPPIQWTSDWPREDRPRSMRPNRGWRWLQSGRAQGRLVGGNLSALRTVAGTAYWPPCRGAILLIE
ncbi:MAG TPA: LD-carboxypeptidase, partial [Chloroflexota bacterium]|nr:LD-carboxypeptidase [Chloroflexota bacterium]